jgi:fructokinase
METENTPQPEIVCLGEILIDLFPAELGRKLADVSAFHPNPGGAPANVAVAVRRLGVESGFIGKVGDDAFGYHLIEVLKQQGVETQGMRVDASARTTLAFIALPDENTAEFVFYRNPGADLRLWPDELDRNMIEKARALHIGSLSLVDEPARSATYQAIRWARMEGALISLDVNYRPSLWSSPRDALVQIREMLPYANLLKLNETELSLLTDGDDEAGVKRLLSQGPELVVVTLGAKGSLLFTKDVRCFMPAFQVQTVDAVGCGDAFIAGLLTRIAVSSDWRKNLKEPYLLESLKYANAVGALTALKHGVIPALPSSEEVDRFLETAILPAETI